MRDSAACLSILSSLIDRARTAGADAADALIVERQSIQVSLRLGKRESLERSESVDLGLRVFVGRRQAIVSSSDISETALSGLAERALAMAAAVPEDRYCGLADPEQIQPAETDLESFDPEEVDGETLFERAREAEDAARAVQGVTNSEGGEASWGRSRVNIAASNGFSGGHDRSWHSLSVSVLAGEGTGMERDYDYRTSVFGDDLGSAEALGTSAGTRAVRRLHPRKVATAKVPVVYDPRVSQSLLSHFSTAINGQSVARGTTFLRDRMGDAIFAPGISIIDDPLRRRGLRSRPFDGEGIAARRLTLVEAGVLQSWLLDLASARQLGLSTTGHASRGPSSPPSPGASNLYMASGPLTPEALIADIDRGFYVTELIGFGINGVTGDYSRGASGFWIENGKITYPVSEVTVSGNLLEMYRALTPANDLEFRYGVDAPTLRIEGMTVAGQ